MPAWLPRLVTDMEENRIPLAPTMLFRFAAPCYRSQQIWKDEGAKLSKKFQLPCFAELEETPLFGDLRIAWNDDGIGFMLNVKGKKQNLWCRDSQAIASDGIQFWLDTRDTHNVHRASKFCHHFIFLPAGGGKDHASPLAALYAIHRAREHPDPADRHDLRVSASVRKDGYSLFGRIGRKALNGYDPQEHKQIGFSYLIIDRELGEQAFSVGSEYPISEDPSLWGTLDLV